jgi:hypothetical protein
MKRWLSCSILNKVFLLLFFALSVYAGEDSLAQERGSFEELVTKVKAFDRSVDFGALRRSYAQTEEYNPYGDDRDIRSAMSKALEAEQFEQAIEAAQTVLKKNFVDLDAHLVCRLAYEQLGNPEKAGFHDFVLKGLLRSLVNSGDGKSPEAAYRVIHISEEYVVLDLLNLVKKEQRLVGLNGHQYDVIAAVHRETKEERTLYFNVDIPFGWISSRFKK